MHTAGLRPAAGARLGHGAALLTSVVCAAAALGLAWHHPLSPTLAASTWLLAAALAWRSPSVGLAMVPALLPVLAFAPWTGWLTFEELDLLVLATAAGGHARQALHRDAMREPGRSAVSPWAWMLMVATALAFAWSAWRGIVDAGGWAFGWYHGYHEPMNSLRLVKAPLWAALLLPLWLIEDRRDAATMTRRMAGGLAVGLALVAAAVVWERLAFTGLLNFSSGYRTTALFWEMHVGGAALDGHLALSVPVVLGALLATTSPRRWMLLAGVLAAAGYVSLTTFSRGVYLAVPLGLLTTWVLSTRQQGAGKAPAAALRALGLVVAFAAAAAWLFPTSGYRGLLAWLGVAALLLRLDAPASGRGVSLADLGIGAAVGAALTAAVAAMTLAVPKGAYVAYALAVSWCALACLRPLRRGWRLGAYVGVLAGMAAVCRHWGGEAALARAWPVLALALTMAVVVLQRGAPWPMRWRWQAGVAAGWLTAAAAVAVFSGGAYMSDRFSTVAQDWQGRIRHWQQALVQLDTPMDWALGTGTGRYPAHHLIGGEEPPGDYRLRRSADGTHLVLTGGRHAMGWGELLRVSQRIDVPPRPVTLTLRARADTPVPLHAEVCEKHLLYNGGCLIKQVRVAAGGWQTVTVPLDGRGVARGAWYAPRQIVFSIAVGKAGTSLEVDDLVLAGADGRNLLANGGFDDGMARWFFSSDRHHMPWHLKNMAMHLLFEQGVAGLALVAAIVLTAMWRLTLGAAKSHPAAPAIAGALVAFAVVGAFDSLLDVPRVALLFWWLALAALVMKGSAARWPRANARPRPQRADVPTGTAAAAGVLIVAVLMGAPAALAREVMRVGPQQPVKTLAEAARLAADGTTIEVDAGTYTADVAVWARNDLTLRAVGGRVHLVAGGAAAEQKAIWVVRAERMTVEGFDFTGTRVPSRNGAGIRFERGSLTVRDCRFLDNEMGLLTGNDPASVLVVENSEFAHNRREDGHNHQLYAGTIARLSVQASYFHHGHIGHLLKSRAAVSDIRNNRLTDEGGSSSYELEFPNGGVAIVVGNVIGQSATTQNPHVVSYAAEGYRWTTNELRLEHNTLVDALPQGGRFLAVKPGPVSVRTRGNLLIGSGAPLSSAGPGDYDADVTIR